MIETFKNKTMFFIVLGLCLFMQGCRSTLYDRFYIEEDYSRARMAKANLDDGVEGNIISVGASIFPVGRSYRYKGETVIKGKFDQIVAHDPYRISISIGVPYGKVLGKIRTIEIFEFYFEICKKTGGEDKIFLSNDIQKWSKYDTKNETTFGTNLKMQNIGGDNGTIDIDYANLKEVRFYIKYVGIYENGERREYWQERYYVPKFVSERRNWFDWLSSF